MVMKITGDITGEAGLPASPRYHRLVSPSGSVDQRTLLDFIFTPQILFLGNPSRLEVRLQFVESLLVLVFVICARAAGSNRRAANKTATATQVVGHRNSKESDQKPSGKIHD
jgi:hypothetical protein